MFLIALYGPYLGFVILTMLEVLVNTASFLLRSVVTVVEWVARNL